MARLRQGGARSDYQRNIHAIPADTYNESGQIRLHHDARGKHLDNYGVVTNHYDNDYTTQYFNDRVSDTNWHEKGTTWRSADDGLVTKTQIGVSNGVPIYHESNGKRTHGSRMYSKFAQGAFSTKYRKDHTMVAPYSPEETGLSMSVDIRHDKSHKKNVHDRMQAHHRKTIHYQSLRKKPDPLLVYTDAQKNPMMTRVTPIYSQGDRGQQDLDEQMARTSGKGDPLAKYHKLTSRDEEIMRRLKINPKNGQIMSAKLITAPANVAHTAQSGVGFKSGPISKDEVHTEIHPAHKSLSNSRGTKASTRDHMSGPFVEYLADDKKINPLLLNTKILATSRLVGSSAAPVESDTTKMATKTTTPSAAFTQFWQELPKAIQDNDMKKVEELLDSYSHFSRVESASVQASNKTADNWDNEVSKHSEPMITALSQLEREHPHLWKTLENSESPKIRAKIVEMRRGKLDKSYEGQQLNRHVELSMKRREVHKVRANLGKRDTKYVKEATDFETRLLEDRIVTDRYRIQEWRNGEITMTGKQMENKERPNYDDKVQSDGISQVHETGVADHSLFGAEEPTTKPVQASNRTSRYGKPVATSRVPISKDT